MAELSDFLEGSSVASRAKVPARVIFRSMTCSTADLSRALRNGEVVFDGPHCCVLEVGGAKLASGEIVERDGSYCFVTTEVYE